jgi:nicotinamide-nucleotide amidase
VTEPQPAARALVEEAVRRALTVATAESLTGGALAAAVVDVPGASACFEGAVVSYSNRVKTEVLGVPARLLAERGSVDPDVAVAMAEGARRRLGTDWAVSTTGAAGPEPHDGKPVGTVYLGVAGPGGDPGGRRARRPRAAHGGPGAPSQLTVKNRLLRGRMEPSAGLAMIAGSS